jgi:PAS domain S-box-containing protein
LAGQGIANLPALYAAAAFRKLLGAQRRTGYPIRIYFVVMVGAIIVPALLVAGWLAGNAAASERARIEQNAQLRAREIAVAIDREIISIKNIVTALASSHLLQTGDIEGFYRQAVEVAGQLGLQIVLRDLPGDRQIFNTALPRGASLGRGFPPAIVEAEAEARRTGKPAVSNLFFGPLVKRYTVSVMLPVARGEGLIYVLSIALPAEAIAEALHRSPLDDGWLVTVVDRSRTIVARSERHAGFVGRTLPEAALPLDVKGARKGKNLEGTPVSWFYHRSDGAGWYVHVAVPERILEAPSKLAIASFATAGSLLLLIGVILADRLGGRIAGAIGGLRAAAIALPQQQAVAATRTFLRETNELSDALSTVSAELRAHEAHRTFAVEAAEIGIWVDDFVRHELIWSDRYREIIGVPAATKPDRNTFLGKVHSADRCMVERRVQECLAGNDRYDVEYRIIAESDTSPRWISVRGRVDRDHTGKPLRMQGIVQDISERKRAEQERDELRRRLMRVQEAERLRLAHELHDQTGQTLAAVMMELKGVEPLVKAEGHARLQRLRTQLGQMGQTLHRVAWELRPASIAELGLTKALADYISEWSEQFGIDADFHCGDPDLDHCPQELLTTVYRVVQEALSNVAKHAEGATSVGIVLERKGARLCLAIEDNGCGFDANATALHAGASREGGLGLAGMRERLSLIAGEIEIESSIGVGTTIFARIGLEQGGLAG